MAQRLIFPGRLPEIGRQGSTISATAPADATFRRRDALSQLCALPRLKGLQERAFEDSSRNRWKYRWF